jgi:hypothetical protein
MLAHKQSDHLGLGGGFGVKGTVEMDGRNLLAGEWLGRMGSREDWGQPFR